MSAVDIHVDTREIERAIGEIGNRVSQVALPIIGATLSTAIDELIQSEGKAGTDGPWDPFSPTTYKLHPRRSGGKLLQDTGLLASMQIEEGPDWVEVGSHAPYAGYHVKGTTKNAIPGMGPMPARNYLAVDLDRVLEDAVDQIVEEAVKR
ncbi:MAG: hypothetical protein GY854_02300 [Deltaproteobacteria bacterium]|nr:hypothetical protein [Deltaproteobacteria bacterium]